MQFKVEKNTLRRTVLQLLQAFSSTDFQKHEQKRTPPFRTSLLWLWQGIGLWNPNSFCWCKGRKRIDILWWISWENFKENFPMVSCSVYPYVFIIQIFKTICESTPLSTPLSQGSHKPPYPKRITKKAKWWCIVWEFCSCCNFINSRRSLEDSSTKVLFLFLLLWKHT